MAIKGKENIKATDNKRKELADRFALVIAPMFLLLSKQMSQRKLVVYLNEHGVKSPTGKEWGLSSLQNVLKRIKIIEESGTN